MGPRTVLLTAHGRMDCPVTDYLFDNRKPPVLLCIQLLHHTVVFASDLVVRVDQRRVLGSGLEWIGVLTKFSFDASNCLICLNYINIPPQLQLCQCPNLLGHRKVNEDLLTTTADYHDTQIA
jgi:hypothetical protein